MALGKENMSSASQVKEWGTRSGRCHLRVDCWAQRPGAGWADGMTVRPGGGDGRSPPQRDY